MRGDILQDSVKGVGVGHLGVPVAVEEDDGVCSEQIDPLSPRPGYMVRGETYRQTVRQTDAGECGCGMHISGGGVVCGGGGCVCAPGGETEDEEVGLRSVEHVDVDLPHDSVGGSVQTTVVVPPHVQIVTARMKG